MAWDTPLKYVPDSGLQLVPYREQIQNGHAHVKTISFSVNLIEFKIYNPNLHYSVEIRRTLASYYLVNELINSHLEMENYTTLHKHILTYKGSLIQKVKHLKKCGTVNLDTSRLFLECLPVTLASARKKVQKRNLIFSCKI